MRHWKTVLAVVAMAGMLAVAGAAQMGGRLAGKVLDESGKPWAGVTVVISSQATGAKFTLKTDTHGQYSQMGIAPGIYTVSFETEKYPPQNFQLRVSAGGTVTQNLSFKELLEKNPQYLEAIKKQEEEKQKFAALKTHFEAGRKAIDQMNALRQKLPTEPADQRAQTKQQITELSQTAVNELSQAKTAAGPTNRNLPTILGNLGVAYEVAGQHDEAAATFQQAAQLDPTNPNYLLGAATNLAYSGKLQDASANCDKIATISVPTAGTCWHNIGVVLYNTSHLKEAVEPLQKSTQSDPTNAETWYLLGTALMNTMETRMENGKVVGVVKPGTAEAFQKYLELAPNGPHAAEVQQTLQVLKQLGAGVDTKYSAPKKKKH
jgi:Flp pilus assembly protein TadD